MGYNLDRFILAQQQDYAKALMELQEGYKRTHWIWYIFPQLKDLSISPKAVYYGLEGFDEACEYYQNVYLKNNLLEISKVLFEIKNNDIEAIMGYPDNLKLRSSMTLFNCVDPDERIFQEVLNKYYDGIKDEVTLKLIRSK